MNYEEKLEAKRQKYLDMADRARARSNAAYEGTKRILDCIPPGQPILVGHHSERRHRSDLNRVDAGMRKSFEEDKKAKYYEGKAFGVGTAGISSDDENAVSKLEEKIANLEKEKERMKAVNKAWRKYASKKDDSELKKLGFNDEGIARLAEQVEKAYSWEKQPYAGFELTSIGAKIKTAKQRIEVLSARPSESSEKEVSGIKVVENVDENRIQLIFPGKPDADTRTLLKKSGFRWSPTNGAWQRHLNSAGKYAAERILNEIAKKS